MPAIAKMKNKKVELSPKQKEFQKIKKFVLKRFPGAHTVAVPTCGNQLLYQVVDANNRVVVSPELMIPLGKTVTQAWTNAKYGAWFSNMIRKSNNAFSEEKMWKKLARDNKED
jgi:hypothetical protein